MNQTQDSSAAPHHVPVPILEGAAVGLLQQGFGRCIPLGSSQDGREAEPAHQELQQLRLLLEGGALPEPLQQRIQTGFFQFLLLFGGQRFVQAAALESLVGLGCADGSLRLRIGQIRPASLVGQVVQAAELHGGSTQHSAPQGLPKPQEGVRAALEGSFFDRDQQQR